MRQAHSPALSIHSHLFYHESTRSIPRIFPCTCAVTEHQSIDLQPATQRPQPLSRAIQSSIACPRRFVATHRSCSSINTLASSPRSIRFLAAPSVSAPNIVNSPVYPLFIAHTQLISNPLTFTMADSKDREKQFKYRQEIQQASTPPFLAISLSYVITPYWPYFGFTFHPGKCLV